jgi:alkanesulfonate monooxygenase SsuD/methylene tetrahydromethanopterin reductase-like flavin-dependent oxidoreductase (luciferase family)
MGSSRLCLRRGKHVGRSKQMVSVCRAQQTRLAIQAGSACIGTPPDIVEMLRSYNERVGGIDSVSLHFTPGNMLVEMAERSLRLFSKEVMPKVSGL